MILTRKDLKEYIKADRARYGLRKILLLGRILNDESYYVTKFLYCLRHLEYYKNNSDKLLFKIPLVYWFLRHRYLELKLGIRISPNVVGKGIYIPHFVGGIIINALRVGDNCIFNSGVIVGNKYNPKDKPIIGDNVEITIGSKIIGKVNIGNNVIVAPNSVVIHDVPDNTVVSGVPAKIIKYNDKSSTSYTKSE